MKSNILTIIRKEFQRFFGDRRMLLSTVLLPGVMIYVIYSLMGTFMADRFTVGEEERPVVCVQALPQSLEPVFAQLPLTLQFVDDAAQAREAVASDAAAAYVEFPEAFDGSVAAYDVQSGEAAPNIKIYYNSASVASDSARAMLINALDAYENSLANRFDINAGADDYDLASERDLTGMIFSMMVPMLMLMFVFSGCMAVAPESIAGEKERGTIATLLVTPMKRSELAIGKIVSLSAIALLSGFSSFLGTILSLPKLMGMSGAEMNVSVYSIAAYGQLLLVVLSTVLVIIALISIISAFAKSVKEASTTISPLMVLVMLIGITSMLGNGAPQQPLLYLIPLYNSVQAMNGILAFSTNGLHIALTVVSNVIYACAGAFVLTKMFNSEKIMFTR